MPQAQIIAPHGRSVRMVTIDDAQCRRLNTVTQPGFGFDIETWETVEESPYPADPMRPGSITIHLER